MGVKPFTRLTKTLRVLLMICIPVNLIACVADIFTYIAFENFSIINDPNEALFTSQKVADKVDLVQWILFPVVGVLFLRWIYRCCKNITAQAVVSIHFTPAWSVAWYFIPIANLFKPYQAMKELYYISFRDRVTSDAIIPLWWILWLSANLVGCIDGRLTAWADTIAMYKIAAGSGILANLLDVALNVAALTLVTRIGQAYLDNYENRKLTDEEQGRHGSVRILQKRR